MERKIVYSKGSAATPVCSWIYEILPEQVLKSFGRADKQILDSISEIRLRADGVSAVTVHGQNLIITHNGIKSSASAEIRLSEKDIDGFIYRLCKGSVYSYENSIAGGFITVNGVRTGISGEVIMKNGSVCGFSKIKSVNIRLPRHVPDCADKLISHIQKYGFDGLGGILVASAPGVGKTTVLRELAVKLSGGIKDKFGKERLYRVSLVDERCELYIPSLFTNCCADIFTGIPKHLGIELASRSMSPEVIIFDELGSEADAKAVMSAYFGGITFISSVHASSPEDVRNKKIIRHLADEGIFTHIYFLSRLHDGSTDGTFSKVLI